MTQPTALVDLRTIDWRNHSYTLPCGEGEQSVTLQGGTWQAPGGPWGGAVESIAVSYIDLDHDGHREALVSLPCTVGAGSNVALDILAFKATVSGAERAGQALFGVLQPTSSASSTIVLASPYFSPSDPRCCASQQDITTYRFENGAFQALGTQRLPAARGD